MNQQFYRCLLICPITTVTVCLSLALPSEANTLIRGRFEYNVDERELSEWQIGPAFLFGDSNQVKLEIPLGQNDGEWLTEPELTYELELDENSNLEFSVGAEIPLSEVGEVIQPFGSIQLGIDF